MHVSKVEKFVHYQKDFCTKQFSTLLEVGTKSYSKSREKIMGKSKEIKQNWIRIKNLVSVSLECP